MTCTAEADLDVVVIGAGLSGIGAARELRRRCPWARVAILEARDAIGGTWDLFRYPGVRSDSDMYTLGYRTKPWVGDKALVDGPSILAYVREAAAETGVDRLVRFGRRVVAMGWSGETARWTVTVEGDGGAQEVLTARWVHSCTGYYRYDHGHRPDFAGIERFGGTVVHPQHWPADLDVTGARVVVIGSGATAVTLVPALAETAAKVTMLQRSPTYVASVPQRDPIVEGLRKVLPGRLAHPVTRWVKAALAVVTYSLSQRRPGVMKRILRKGLEAALPAGYDIDTHFTPTYDPWDQRMCAVPDGDLFVAISDGRADVVTDHVDTFTPTGIRLRSGATLDADVVVTATGLELLFLGGIALEVDGIAVDPADRLAYQGMMLEGVPNLSFAVGYTNASWTLRADLIADALCRLLTRMRRRHVRQATPTEGAGAVADAPLLPLRSGYVTRGAHLLPRAGAGAPWRVQQNYFQDLVTMRRHGATHPALVLSNPDPRSTPMTSPLPVGAGR